MSLTIFLPSPMAVEAGDIVVDSVAIGSPQVRLALAFLVTSAGGRCPAPSWPTSCGPIASRGPGKGRCGAWSAGYGERGAPPGCRRPTW